MSALFELTDLNLLGDWASSLNTLGSWASIISLPLSVYAAYKVWRFKRLLRARALDARVRAAFLQLRALPHRPYITTAARQDVASLLQDLEDFYLARLRFLDVEPKVIIARVRLNLQVQSDMVQLKRDLDSLEALVLTSARI